MAQVVEQPAAAGAPVEDRPWLAYYDPGVPHSIEYPWVAVPELLAHAAAAHARRPATWFFGATISYRRLADLVDRFAGALYDCGVRQGDRVAIMLPNCPQFVIAFYATLRLGAVAVPTNPLYKTREVALQLADAGAETVIVLDLLYETVKHALPETSVRTTIVTGLQDFMPWWVARLYPLKLRRGGKRLPALQGEPVRQFRALLDHAPWSAPAPATPDSLAVLQYTGGTTGVPKGAMLTHRNLVANAVQAWHWQPAAIKRPGEGSNLCVTPFFHVYGLSAGMNTSIFGGVCMLLLPRFVASDVVAVIRKHRPSRFPGVPTMYLALAEHPGIKPADCSSLQMCISGSAPLQGSIQEAFREKAGGHVVEGYGLTEAAPVVLCNPLRRPRTGAAGVPFPDTHVAIVDRDTGKRLPPGMAGELMVRGPQVMRGYWHRPDETAAIFFDGWLRTGDIAAMDHEGYVTILDRAKDIIIASGFNIYPREVEEMLCTHPAVQEAAVVGVPDTYRGETVKAFLVLKSGAQATEREIIDYVRTRIAVFKAPTAVEFRTALPRTTIGKVMRRALVPTPDERMHR
ncbi:MAG TPA: long-chain fatty acid--CoA ligase [Chloroflexota bacterium]|jgi:long-chain acyl-CoA synthetase|nr:long-chain fatty acid--CoA ligase [Chloroflexota bacterium]